MYLDRTNQESNQDLAFGLCNDIESAFVPSTQLPPYQTMSGFAYQPASYSFYPGAFEACKDTVGLYSPPQIVSNMSTYFECEKGPRFVYSVWTGFRRFNLTHFIDG